MGSLKPVIIGQAPSSGGQASSRRLAALCDLEHDAFLARFERVNLVQVYRGKKGKGDAFPLDEARASYARLIKHLRGRRVILLGRAVAKIADVEAPYFAWVWHDNVGVLFAACPHPSSVNLWWNDPKNVQAARKFWRGIAG